MQGLLDYAQKQFRLQQVVEGGATEESHLRQLAKSKKKNPDDLIDEYYGEAECPADAVYLFEIFVDLSQSRIDFGLGPRAISYTEIEAFMRVTHTPLEPWEIEAVLELDRAFLEYYRGSRGTDIQDSVNSGNTGPRKT